MAGTGTYMSNLLQLDSRGKQESGSVYSRLAPLATPLILPAWQRKLSKHPDKEFTAYVLNGIEQGFRIGVEVDKQFQSARRNMQSAGKNQQVIDEYIEKEVTKGNILGPFSKAIAPKVHINRFGVIPQKYQPGKWRLITDLSFRRG